MLAGKFGLGILAADRHVVRPFKYISFVTKWIDKEIKFGGRGYHVVPLPHDLLFVQHRLLGSPPHAMIMQNSAASYKL
jgi:hypothetical protein